MKMNLAVVALVLSLGSLVQAAPEGLSFDETMSGTCGSGSDKVKCAVKVHVDIQDIDLWSGDSNHRAVTKGTLAWGDKRYPFEGNLDLMKKAGPSYGYYLEYTGQSLNGQKPVFSFDARKHVYNDGKFSLIDNMTVLNGVIQMEGTATSPSPLAMRFKWENPIIMGGFLVSFKVHNASDIEEQIAVKKKFSSVVLKGILEEYLHLNLRP